MQHNKPMSDEQIMVLWRQSGGHAIRFARLIEYFHGFSVAKPQGEKSAS